MFEIYSILENIYNNPKPKEEDVVCLLATSTKDEIKAIFDFADKIRKEFMGEGILLRGIIEFSNYCKNYCFYCGLNKNNLELPRYRLNKEELLESISLINSYNIKTVVLQSGEEDDLDIFWLKEIIEEIKLRFNMAITLSLGERKKTDYKLWKDAGADRYLLKIETTDKKLYRYLHPQMSLKNRLNCLDNLKELGFQVGSGIIVGLKNQTLNSIAKDIIFFKNKNFDMIGIGPFIPHQKTQLAKEKIGDVELTLKTIALTRILTKNSHLPATTALGSLVRDFRLEGLKAGANVLMPNFTPQPYRKLYEIYPNKRCIDEKVGSCSLCMENMAQSINRVIDYSKGDSLKIDS